jgi:ABC-type lipoprotein export system ATPase subunit
MSVRKNIGFGLAMQNRSKAEIERKVDEALSIVRLTDQGDKLPGQLSGGQQQRVAIARALVGRPQLLLADEPTGNLDSASARQIMDLLARINAEEGMTIIMVTHDHEFAARAHRKLHILDGKLIDPSGSPGGAPSGASPPGAG